ncbi:MAG: PH domain-containing protein [Sedimentisphaerales bacterium]|nr:PH domain-containing protein [Sedimentisphaerales bacterium]
METLHKKPKRYVFPDDSAEGIKLKKCVFCAEPIQAQAIKCRFCNEFLNTDKARAARKAAKQAEEGFEETEQDSSILFAGRPSLFGLASAAIKSAFLLTIAWLLFRFPAENWVVIFLDKFTDFQLTDAQYFNLARWINIAGFGLAALVLLIFFYKVLKLKMTRYEVTVDRIEHSRGIFDRRVDNLDMFRVIDLKLRRTIIDCIVGVGQVVLTTTDKSDPEFTFLKIRRSRQLYDVIKKASLDADQKQGVIHLE